MMDKNKYLDKLGGRLDKLPLGELGKAMQKYEKYFEDAGEENEQKVISELGPYKELAAKIEEEFFLKDEYFLKDKRSEKKNKVSIIRIIILILTFYIWIPLIIAAYIFEIVLLIGGLILGFGGLFLFIIGIMLLFTSVPTGIFFMGTGLILVAMGILLFLAGLVLMKLTRRAIAFIFGKKKRGDDHE